MLLVSLTTFVDAQDGATAPLPTGVENKAPAAASDPTPAAAPSAPADAANNSSDPAAPSTPDQPQAAPADELKPDANYTGPRIESIYP